MAKAQPTETATEKTIELLKDLLIVQLRLAGVAQQAIQKIVRVDIGRVNRIAKHLPTKKEALFTKGPKKKRK